MLIRLIYKFLERLFPPDSIESYIEYKLPDYSDKRKKWVVNIFSWVIYFIILLMVIAEYASIWPVFFSIIAIEYILNRMRERYILVDLPEKLIRSNNFSNQQVLKSYSENMLGVPGYDMVMVAEIAGRFVWMRTLQMVVVIILLVMIPLFFSMYYYESVSPLWQGVIIYCVGLAIGSLTLYPTVLMEYYALNIEDLIKLKLQSISGALVNKYRITGGRIGLYILVPFVYCIGFVLIGRNEPELLFLLMLMFCGISLFAPFHYHKNKKENFRGIIEGINYLLRVVNLEVFKNVFHDPDWFRGEEKFLLECCARYGNKPEAFQKLFEEREREVARILGSTST